MVAAAGIHLNTSHTISYDSHWTHRMMKIHNYGIYK